VGDTRAQALALWAMRLPRILIWTQVLIVVFVVAGIVIAITKLA
jgi:hypothetical protein